MCPLSTRHRAWLSGRGAPLWTGLPLCRPSIPAAVPGLGGCGCRHSSSLFWQLLWLPGTSAERRPHPVPCVWGPGLHPGARQGGQGYRAAGGAAEEPPPAPASRPHPSPQLCALFKVFHSCSAPAAFPDQPSFPLTPARGAWQAAEQAGEGRGSLPGRWSQALFSGPTPSHHKGDTPGLADPSPLILLFPQHMGDFPL